MNKIKVLFLCTGNSCRSQMAEGLCNEILGDKIESYSAGIEKYGLNPLAVKVMEEIGINITNQESNTFDEIKETVDYIITVCGNADKTCPNIIGNIKKIHKGFDDPPKLAINEEKEEDKLIHYRRVRDEIRAYIKTLPEELM